VRGVVTGGEMVVMAVAQHRRRKYARITQIFVIPQMRKLSEEI